MAKTARIPLAGLMGMIAIMALVLAIPTQSQWNATQAPPLDRIRLRSHAVERHGAQARTARERVFDCKEQNLRAKICPPGRRYGMRVHFWCESEASGLCPGIVTTIGGVEKTSLIKPCTYWARCHP
jgi:hypothetical protein